MTKLASLEDFEEMINRGSGLRSYVLGVPVQKGIVGSHNQYRFVINTRDHMPPHIHISLNNEQIAKYDLRTGEVIESRYPKLNEVFRKWYEDNGNRSKAINEWERAHGPIS